MKRHIIYIIVLALVVLFPLSTNAQWETSGINIYNTNTGNVGIGTASPSDLLHVQGSVIKTVVDGVGRIGIGESIDPSFDLHILRTGSDAQLVVARTSTFSILSNTIDTEIGTISNHPLYIATNNATAISIDTSQNVGIGTDSPQAKLEVLEASDDYQMIIRSTSGNTGDTAGLLFGTSSSTAHTKAGIFFERDAVGHAEGNMIFALQNINNSGTVTKDDAVMTLLKSGNVGIGTTSPSALLHLERDIAVSSPETALSYTISGSPVFGSNLLTIQIPEDGTGAGLAFGQGAHTSLGGTSGDLFQIWRRNQKKFSIDSLGAVAVETTNSGIGESFSFQITGPYIGHASQIQHAFEINDTYTSIIDTTGYASIFVNTVVNQDGVDTGITRGLYINPTLTSATDYRAIQLDNDDGFGIYQSNAGASNYFAGTVDIDGDLEISGNLTSDGDICIGVCE